MSQKLKADALVFPNESGPTRQTARIQTKANRLPRETELRPVRIKTRQQVRGRTVLLEFLPPQISAHICDAQPAGTRLRHQDLAELDGTQGLGFYEGVPESGSEQRRDDAGKFQRVGCPGPLRLDALKYQAAHGLATRANTPRDLIAASR